MGRYMRGKVNAEIAFSGVGPKAANLQVFPDLVTVRTRISSVVATYSLSNYTPVADAGPWLVGLAHSDYSAAEIEEWIENTGSWEEGNLIQQEIADRKIREVGVFDDPDAAADSVVLNDGLPIKTKLNWILTIGQTLDVWVYNLGAASQSGATSANMACRGHANLWAT